MPLIKKARKMPPLAPLMAAPSSETILRSTPELRRKNASQMPALCHLPRPSVRSILTPLTPHHKGKHSSSSLSSIPSSEASIINLGNFIELSDDINSQASIVNLSNYVCVNDSMNSMHEDEIAINNEGNSMSQTSFITDSNTCTIHDMDSTNHSVVNLNNYECNGYYESLNSISIHSSQDSAIHLNNYIALNESENTNTIYSLNSIHSMNSIQTNTDSFINLNNYDCQDYCETNDEDSIIHDEFHNMNDNIIHLNNETTPMNTNEVITISDDEEISNNDSIIIDNDNDISIHENMNTNEIITISDDDDDDDISIIDSNNDISFHESDDSDLYYSPMGGDEYENQCIETAFLHRIQTCRIFPHADEQDEVSFMCGVKDFLYRKISNMQDLYDVVKVNLRLVCLFTKLDNSKICNFKCRNFLVTAGSNLSAELDLAINSILLEIDQFTEHSSGWVFFQNNYLDLCINECDPLHANSFIRLPKWIHDKKCIINIKNVNDQQCFQWSILSALHSDLPNPTSIPDLYYPFINELDFSNIEFPVTLSNISKFETKNSIKVNVLSYNSNKKIYPLYYNTKSHYDRVVNLLFITEGDKSHYCYITNLSRLLSAQLSAHAHTLFFCMNCLNHFSTQLLLTQHETFCHLHATARIELPLKKPFCQFREYNKCYRVPFTCFADFECLLVPSTGNKVQEHIPSSFAYIIRGDADNFFKFETYRGEKAGEVFVKRIYKDAQDLYNRFLKNTKNMIMTRNDWIIFRNAKFCGLCNKTFKSYTECQQNEAYKNDFKVHDHNHITGAFRNVLCNSCNLLCKQPSFLPVVFHNGSRYDFHLFVKSLCIDNTDISVITSTDETYISIMKKVDVGEKRKFSLRFLDSFRFLPYSLETLAASLTEQQAQYTMQEFPNTHQLMRRKGVFPYDYITGFDKYDELSLPSKKNFYSHLSSSPISDADYHHAEEVWRTFQIQNLGQYSDLYLKTDVYLLCDVMETFRTTCYANYSLDPLHFYTSPGLSWSAMLKFSHIRLELLLDYEMILFIEQGIRGGVSQVSHRYVEANIPSSANFNPDTPSSSLIHLDINNLYGFGMCEPLPIDGFTWLTQDECNNLYNNSWDDNSNQGYILEVDLNYPPHLHNMHNEYPLAPEKHIIPSEWVSPYISDTFKPSSLPKLLTTLLPKTHYIVHSKTLKLYLSLGMELVCIHRGLVFNQSPWLKSYVEFNTNLRQTTKDLFGKEFYKLMVNSMFGKTMENVRLYTKIVLCQSWAVARKYIAKPSFKETKVFSENLIAVHMYKEKVTFNKPIYLGMSILDLSKHCVYNFHYNVMLVKYQKDITLCYTDTDSFFYWLRNHNFYDDLKDQNFKQYFDLSNYPSSHPLASQTNKMVLGKVKDECGGKLITHFVGLRSKMYSYLLSDGSATKKIKGIKKCVIKNDITFDDFVSCLNRKQSQEKTFRLITSRMHDISTITTVKKTLCALDDKKFILSEDGITCLSYGHINLNRT